MHYFTVLLLMCNCAPFKVKRFVKMAFKFLGYPCFKCFIEVIKFCLYIPLSCSSLQKLSLKSRLDSGYCRIGGQGPHIWEYLKYSWTVELKIWKYGLHWSVLSDKIHITDPSGSWQLPILECIGGWHWQCYYCLKTISQEVRKNPS